MDLIGSLVHGQGKDVRFVHYGGWWKGLLFGLVDKENSITSVTLEPM